VPMGIGAFQQRTMDSALRRPASTCLPRKQPRQWLSVVTVLSLAAGGCSAELQGRQVFSKRETGACNRVPCHSHGLGKHSPGAQYY
jgi:hypothetical protein